MTAPRWLASLATSAALALAAFAQEAPPDAAKLREAMERVYVAAQADHAKVRGGAFGEGLDAFVKDLAATLGAVAATAPDAATDAAARDAMLARTAKALVSTANAPICEASLRLVLAQMLPADRAAWPQTGDPDALRAAFVAAARGVFAEPAFPDCWDARFRDVPEVAAWRAAQKPAEAPAPAPPTGSSPPAAEPSEPPPVAPPPVAPPVDTPPPAPPRDTGLPSPFAEDPEANLVVLDRAKAWVGPWTGWTQEIPDRDNKRQRRPGKLVYVDRYEVTCGDYLRFLRSVEPSKRSALLPVGWTIDDANEPAHPAGRERHPVVNVTVFQAVAYADAQGKRLPTEDEWERAAGGGDKEERAFPWGTDPDDREWCFALKDGESTVPVDAYPQDITPEGVVGFAGNVAEMVATQPDRRDLPAKLLPTTEVVIRGGSWRTPRASECTTTYRWRVEAASTNPHVGFRCVMDEAEHRKRAPRPGTDGR